MGIVIEFLVVVGLVGLVASYFFRGKRDAEREDVIERRVAAYIETIRRERSNPDLVAMSDFELRDLLLSGARNLRVQAERRWYVMLGAAGLAFVAAILVATQDGMRGFGIALLVGAAVIYGVNEYLGRRSREPLLARGIDVERLRVE